MHAAIANQVADSFHQRIRNQSPQLNTPRGGSQYLQELLSRQDRDNKFIEKSIPGKDESSLQDVDFADLCLGRNGSSGKENNKKPNEDVSTVNASSLSNNLNPSQSKNNRQLSSFARQAANKRSEVLN